MALPATESFTAGDWTVISSLTNWDKAVEDASFTYVISNSCRFDNSWVTLHTWKSDTFNDNQYAQATVVYVEQSWCNGGVAVRGSQTAYTAYLYVGHSTERFLYKVVNATLTALASYTSGGFAVSDVIRIEANSTTITPKLNGSTDANLGAQTDSAITSGYAGLGSKGGAGVGTRIDDWEGGNLGGGATSINLAAAALTAGGQATTLTPGAKSTDLAAATVTASGPALTVSPGAVSITLASGAASAAGQALTVAGGAVSTSLNDAAVTTSGPALTVAPGAVSVSLSAAEAAAAGQALSVTNVSIPTLTAVQVGVAIHLEFALP